MASKGSNQPEDTEPVKSASHQPVRQDVLSNLVNGLPDKKEQKVLPETVVSNPGPNAAWSAGAKSLSWTKADDGRLNQGNVKEMTDKIEERFESLEDKGSLPSIDELTFNDLKRGVGENGTRKVAKPKSDEKPNIIKTEYKVTIHPSRKSLCFPFDASAEDDDLLVKEECIEPTPSVP